MLGDSSLKADDIQAQIKRIVESAELEHSARLKAFLNYIVEEALAGRSRRIKGLTIAQTVFAVDESFDPETNSLVRVEAGRLRRRLKEYYAGSGRHDPILIGVPKGSYVPEFAPNPAHSSPARPGTENLVTSSWLPAKSNALILILLVVIVVLAWPLVRRDDPSPEESTNVREIAGQADATEAQTLFRQAFDVLMPPEDGARLDAALALFRRVVEIAPNFSGGYAGNSLARSFKVLFIKSDDPEKDLDEALALAEKAVGLDPDYSMAYSALAIAHSLKSDSSRAIESARRSLTTSQSGANANAMAALALLISERPREAIDLASKSLRLNPNQSRTPYLNFLGLAYYLTGDFEEAARNMEANLARGGPTGPHIDVFLAATYANLGRDFEARAVIDKLQRTNPNFPVELWLRNYIKSEEGLRATMSKLESLGLSRS